DTLRAESAPMNTWCVFRARSVRAVQPRNRVRAAYMSLHTVAQFLSRNSKRMWLIVVLAAAAAGWYVWRGRVNAASAPDAGTGRPSGEGGGGASKGGGRGANQKGREAAPVPVIGTHAGRGTINVFINGLGSVTPLNTVTVRSRVDGELTHVFYKEGDLVTQGA